MRTGNKDENMNKVKISMKRMRAEKKKNMINASIGTEMRKQKGI